MDAESNVQQQVALKEGMLVSNIYTYNDKIMQKEMDFLLFGWVG